MRQPPGRHKESAVRAVFAVLKIVISNTAKRFAWMRLGAFYSTNIQEEKEWYH